MTAPEPRQGDVHDGRRGLGLTPVSLLIVLLIFYLLIQVQLIIVLVLFSLLFATVIERPVRKLEVRGMPRAMSILTVYVVILLGIVAIGLVFVPILSTEARAFSTEAPRILEDVAEEWRTSDSEFLSRTGYRYITQLKFRLENPPPLTGSRAIGLLSLTGTVIFGIVATFVIGFYYLMEKPLLKRLILEQLHPSSRERVNSVWNDVEAKVGDWLRGQLTLCIIIGVAAGIGYGLLGLKFWLLLAVFAGITELVPIVGPWIGGIPAFAIALLDSWEKAIVVAIFLILLQFTENSILVPRVMKGAIGLSPLTVFLAVLAGGQYMGPIGALLAIPFAAAIQVIVTDAIRVRQQRQVNEPEVQGEHTSAAHWRTLVTQFLGDGEQRRPPVPADPSETPPPTERRRLEQPSEQGDG